MLETFEKQRSADPDPFFLDYVLENQQREASQRYTFEIVVESPDSLVHQLDDFDPVVFTEGITLHSTPTLEKLKAEVMGNE